jgi:hypothetical protein
MPVSQDPFHDDPFMNPLFFGPNQVRMGGVLKYEKLRLLWRKSELTSTLQMGMIDNGESALVPAGGGLGGMSMMNRMGGSMGGSSMVMMSSSFSSGGNVQVSTTTARMGPGGVAEVQRQAGLLSYANTNMLEKLNFSVAWHFLCIPSVQESLACS